MARTMQFKIYRYDPDKDNAPYMQDITVEVDDAVDRKLLDVNKYMSDVKNKLITQTIPLKLQILTMGSKSNPIQCAIPIRVTLIKPVLTEPKAIHAINPVKGDKNIGMMASKSKAPLNGKSVLASINAKAAPNVTDIAVTMEAK